MIATLNSVTAGGGLDLEGYVGLAARYDFRGVEFGIGQAHAMGVAPARELFEAHDVLPVAFGLPVEWRKDQAQFDNDLQQLPALAETARGLGALRCTTYVLPTSAEARDKYAHLSKERLGRCAQILSEQGIMLGLEFLGPQHFRKETEKVWFYNIEGALQAADEINAQAKTDNVGLLIDSWHWYTSGDTVMDLAAVPLSQIVLVHVNDAPKIPVEEQVDNVRLLPGQSGVIEMRGFLSTLDALGYRGPVAVETFSEHLKAVTSDEAAALAASAMRKIFAAADLEY